MALEGKVVLVTGASRGLGRAVAALLAAHGARVAAAARSKSELESIGRGVLAIPADLTDPAQTAAVYQRIDEQFGRIDVAINSAGIGVFGPLDELAPEQLDALVAINFKATFYSCQEAFRRMKRTGGGHIVNVISTSGKIGRANEAAYTATKWAVTGLTESLKLEGKPHRIRATAFCPGGMETPFWDTESGRSHRGPKPSAFMPAEAVAQILVGLLELPEGVLVDDITIKRA
ncbi:MAG TPA: SDR family oxidoreductase [Bryobacteraceae bacterium]|nr:SDR family oxidoreductase [Bryobacteraceae bacterium]